MSIPIPAAARICGLLAPALLSGCLMGGTGTDTENGVSGNVTRNPNAFRGVAARVTDGAGAPLAGVALRLFPPDYRPDSGAIPPAPVSNPPESLVSDTGGYVRLSLKAAGKFVVEGLAGGATLFFDTLAVADTAEPAIYTFRARPARDFRGRVTLASGMRIDSGRVFIRGTGRTALLDATGGYDLGDLPADATRMGLGVRFAASPVAVLRAQPATPDVQIDSTRPAYACKETNADTGLHSGSAESPQTTARLDTAAVIKALQSCDSLAAGSVVKVAGGFPGAAAVPSGEAVSFLVLSGSRADVSGTKQAAPVLVPLAQCVPSAGRESTSFAVEEGAAADLIVEDVAAECLER